MRKIGTIGKICRIVRFGAGNGSGLDKMGGVGRMGKAGDALFGEGRRVFLTAAGWNVGVVAVVLNKLNFFAQM